MVIRVSPKTEEQIKFLSDWESTSSIDFWSRAATTKTFTDIRVSPESYALGLLYTLKIMHCTYFCLM
jgi:carboxypeptidase A2